jgi:flavin-dependent thymidylate synthase
MTFDPRVTLVRTESAQHPFALTVASAWSCYAARPAPVENVLRLWEATDDPERLARRARAAALYQSLFAAGHHTTFQHATFVFIIDGVSRLAIWAFLHAHPYYNSEQVSQRYREVTPRNVVVPPLPPAAETIYRTAVEQALAGYQRLTAILLPVVQEAYATVFPARVRSSRPALQAKVARDLQRRAQEVARYVLPLGISAHLYHTINGLTLLRYHVLASQPDAPTEVRILVDRMVAAVQAVDPHFLGAPGHPLDLRVLALEETLEYQAWRAFCQALQGCADERFFVEFDRDLGELNSRLVDYPADGERLLADAVRAVLGQPRAAMSDAEAIALVLDPRRNPYLGHPLFLGMHSKLMQALGHLRFVFQKKISGAEAAQNQRHRGMTISAPLLWAHLRPEPDVVVPWLIAQHPPARAVFEETVAALWSAKNRLLAMGVSPEYAAYLLPNAHAVRFYESGTLLNYFWKWIKRLCYDAQREIFLTAVQEVAQVSRVLPTIGRYLSRPPCVLRAETGTRPYCPEGERFCGVPVWQDYAFETLVARRRL